MRKLFYFSVTSLFLLTSCTTINAPVAPPPSKISVAKRTPEEITSWNIQGAVGVRAPSNSFTATLDWQQYINHYTISLTGPLGTHAVRLIGGPHHVTLETADGKRVSSTSPEQLLREQTGWNLPVSYLYYWVRGLPVPNLTHQDRFDSEHRIVELNQAGFHVSFLRFATRDQIDLPSKILIAQPSLNIKIVINQWQPH